MRTLGLALFVVSLFGCARLRQDIRAELDRLEKRNLSEVKAREFRVHKKWARSTLSKPHTEFRFENTMAPIVFKSLILQGNSVDGVAGFDQKTGNSPWEFRIKGGAPGEGQVWDGDLFFGGGDGYFYSIRASNGRLNWKVPIYSEGVGSVKVEAARVYFISGSGIFYVLNASDGSVVWQYSRRDSSILSILGASRPGLDSKAVYAGFSDGFVVALDKRSGQLLWEQRLNSNKKFRDVDAEPIVEGDRLYVSSFDGSLHTLDKSTGKIIWRHDEGGHSAPVVTPQYIYLSASTGHVLALEKSSGKEIWRYPLNRGMATQPALYKGFLVIGESSGSLVFLDALSGKKVADYSTGHGIKATPTVHQDSIFVMSVSANLFHFRLERTTLAGTWAWE